MSKGKLCENSQYKRVMETRYKLKYKKLKRFIKSFIFENAALCDQIAQVQEELAIGKEERRFLLNRLMKHEGLGPSDFNSTSQSAGKRGPKKRLTELALIREAKAAFAGKSTIITYGPKKAPLQKIPLDGLGKPIYPLNLGGFTLHALGEIVPENTNFHTPNWIYPVGYVATRIYAHPKEPGRKCVFTCKILNNSGVPQFQIIPDAEFDSVFFGDSANICHLRLLETIVRVTDVKNLPLRAQGERFFGLGNPTVMSLLQSDVNFKNCGIFKGFIVDGGYTIEDKEPTLNYEALQTLITISAFHTVPEVKEEPPDELLE